uniref:Uncharacterized protein n=1 Tax=Magallana gigas TaxID=29159 RepID=K1P1H0_MAGGI
MERFCRDGWKRCYVFTFLDLLSFIYCVGCSADADVKSDVEVEETRVKETTFPEIEDNDTPDTEQDSFDMGDLPPPPPPLPSLNESISNDFPPPPFIEMMGNMTVDMGTPLEEGPQADEPLPSPPRLPLESVQRVPMSVSMLMLPLT